MYLDALMVHTGCSRNEEELAIRRHQLLFRIQTSLGIGSAEAQRIASVVTEAVQSRQNYVRVQSLFIFARPNS